MFKVKDDELEMFINSVCIDFDMKENCDFFNLVDALEDSDARWLMRIINFEELKDWFNEVTSSLFFYVRESYEDCYEEFGEFMDSFGIKYEEINESDISDDDEENYDEYKYFSCLSEFLYEVISGVPGLWGVESYNYYRKIIKDAFDLEEFTCEEVIFKK